MEVVDEFGRSLLLTTLLGSILSLIRALAAATFVICVAFLLVSISEISRFTIFGNLVRFVLDSLESVPPFVWVLAAVSALSQDTFLVVTAVFTFAALPLVFNFLANLARDVMNRPYYKAALALGANDIYMFRRHLIPGMWRQCLAPFLLLVGSALAVYGVIGIFGFVNRSDLDLGVLLLRGKERAFLNPELMVSAIIAYITLFALLRFGIFLATKERNVE